MNEQLFVRLQKMLPQHKLSQLAGSLANSEKPYIKNRFIAWFIKKYQVNMKESFIENPEEFKSFNDFFTRRLKSEIRPQPTDEAVLSSPVDGTIYELGKIDNHTLIQAKGKTFTTDALLADTKEADLFKNGHFITLYLSPKDYHRVHMPFAGKLLSTRFIPGQLFSVNPATCRNVDDLFAKNERLVCLFETVNGPLAVIFVGAMIVASIHTVWHPIAYHSEDGDIKFVNFHHYQPPYARGQEIGHFQLGSTIILLMGKQALEFFPDIKAGNPIKMGDALAK